MTLILNFGLVSKNFNMGYIFWTMGDRVLIDTLYINGPWKELSFGTKTLDYVTLILNFDLLLENNLDYIF